MINEKEEDILTPEVIEDLPAEVQNPPMTINIETPAPEQEIVTSERLSNLYDEILDDLRVNDKNVGEAIDKFDDLATNDGDGTSASKEALVNLYKIKVDIAGAKAKIADQMTRLKMRDRSIPGFIAQHQNNYNIIEGPSRRALIEQERNKKGK